MTEKETKERYIEAVGRRKTSVARVRITPAKKESVLINDKNLNDFFDTEELQNKVMSPFKVANVKDKFTMTVKVLGGGIVGQSEAIRLGLSRCLVKMNQELRGDLKKEGFLKRDPRTKERKKPGLRKARKRPQWSKR